MGKIDRLRAKKKRERLKFLKGMEKQARKKKIKIKIIKLKVKHKKRKAKKEFY